MVNRAWGNTLGSYGQAQKSTPRKWKNSEITEGGIDKGVSS